jgi:hypothetical protein
MRNVLIILISFCVLAFAFEMGVFWGERNAFHRRFLEHKEMLTRILGEQGLTEHVEIIEQYTGDPYLVGKLENPSDRQRLNDAIKEAFGARAVERMAGNIVGKRPGGQDQKPARKEKDPGKE